MKASPHFTFIDHGFASAGVVFPVDKCRELQTDVLRTRDFRRIFLDEAEFRKNPQRSRTNPRPGRNLLGRLNTKFIFFNDEFDQVMRRVAGPRWRVLDQVLITAIPHHFLPDWIKRETDGVHANNLGPYVREEYRDITYLTGIDFHQDIQDFPHRDCDFITAYVYLDDVAADCSPLNVVPRSHELGVTVFPHRIRRAPSGRLLYESGFGESGEYDSVQLLGAGGTLYYWHSATLHGTLPQTGDQPRISVRLLVEKNSRTPDSCELDLVNKNLLRLSLETVRIDVNDHHEDVVREHWADRMRLQ